MPLSQGSTRCQITSVSTLELAACTCERALTLGLVPVEVVSPVIVADESWTKVIDKFWSVILEHFELRRDTTCGFHVHISTRRGNYTLEELRMMAKAVVFWEPATKRMTPWSRHDECLDFCKSNILADVPVNDVLRTDGPLRGLVTAYGNIDRCDRDAIIDYICPSL